jgi:hypothetical protein
MARISEDDEGKSVVMDGDKIGIVQDVRGDTAYVNPDAGITDKIKATLDWGDTDEDTYPLEESQIDAVTDDEIRLQRDSGL